MSITSAQCRGARAMLDITREELARLSEVSARTIADFETDKRQPIKANIAALKRTLENAGIEFTNGDQPGVRLAKKKRAAKRAEF